MRTFRYRAYPTRQQVESLEYQLREAARLYNAALQERRDAWRMQRLSLRLYDQSKQLKLIRADGNLGIANYNVGCEVLKRVDRAFEAFFRRVKAGQKAGFPRFRSARRYDSLTFDHYRDGCRLRENGRLYLQGVGDVKVKLHRPVVGAIKITSIKREAGRWYVLFVCESNDAPLPRSDDAVGVDVGLTSFAVLSNGVEIANPRYAKKAERRLRIAHRKVARRKKRSAGRRKAVRLLQRAHLHVEHQRSDFHHKTARCLVNRFGLIVVEALHLKGLAAGILAKPIHDAGWGMFLQRLTDKAECAGRLVVRVNPNGTTQACSGCGAIVRKTLSERWHSCVDCGLSLGRDENAARNILGLGLSLVAPTWPTRACVAAEADSGSYRSSHARAGASNHLSPSSGPAPG